MRGHYLVPKRLALFVPGAPQAGNRKQRKDGDGHRSNQQVQGIRPESSQLGGRFKFSPGIGLFDEQ